ncbi:chemotaxis protein CheW [Roseomonas sp. CCTCC AB2023176]|uniref:chemotaxis protein CheW n=1 Tax=Roseomonas sp. CCTCC AB2023176 TaxID=3342640 RepID=UPI0035DBC1E7
MLIGGDEVLDPAPPDALPARRPRFPAAPPRLARVVEPAEPPREFASRVPDARLRIADTLLDIPLAAVQALTAMPEIRPLAGAAEGIAGLAWTEWGPVLVLDPTDCEASRAPFLAVLTIEGRRIGLPCERFGPAPRGAAIPEGLKDPDLLRHAPLALPKQKAPETPTRLLLLARVGTAPVAFGVEDVVAVLPAREGGPAPRPSGPVRGLVAHRGDVLPVLDLGESLGGAPVLRGGGSPMLRLAGAAVAVAVTSVGGLRSIPEPDIVGVPGEGTIAALARVDGEPVPVLRARAIAAPFRPAGARP